MKRIVILFSITLLAISFSSCCTLESCALTHDKTTRSDFKRDNITYALPTALLHVIIDQSRSGSGQPALTVSIDETYVADPGQIYTLNLKHSAFSRDDYDIEVDPQTLLIKKVNYQQRRQLGNNLDVSSTDLAEGLTRLIAGIAESGDNAQSNTPFEEFHVEKHVEISQAMCEGGCLLYNSRKCGAFYLHLRPLCSAVYPAESEHRKLDHDYDWDGKSTCESDCCAECEIECESHCGVFYRIGLPYIAEVVRVCKGKAKESIRTEVVSIPNSAPVQFLNLKRRAFVKVGYSISFHHGMPAKIDSSRPSEVLGLLGSPFKAVGATASVLPVPIGPAIRNNKMLRAENHLLKEHFSIMDKRAHLDKTRAIHLLNALH